MDTKFKRWCSSGVVSLAIILAAVPAAPAKQRVLQLAEDHAQTRQITAPRGPLAAAPLTRVCEPGAKWIRLDFTELSLHSYDTLVLTSSGGDRFVFEGDHWNHRSFSARALRGSCVNLQPYFGSPDSRYQVNSFQFGTQALAATPVVVAGAGDICDSSPADCGKTSDLIVAINPTVVFTAGDNAYSNGTLSEYNSRYEPTWGRFKALTSPTPGNHDYNTSGASGYFDYFNGAGNQTGPAGDRSKGYYSYDVGDWHFVALNTMSGSTVSSAQLSWLDADLAANTKPCTAAYFHHPLVSRGHYTGYSQVKPIYDRLYAAKADLVLVGHDHNYQRYAKMDGSQAAKNDGMRQILIGTGGRDFYGLSGSHALLEASQDHTWGVLKLTLTATGYTGDFVPVAGKTWTDSFNGTCNRAGASNTPPVANFSFTTSNLTATFTDSSTDSNGTIASRSWAFGDGITSTTANPNHTYAAAGTYKVALTVTDNGGATHAVSKSVTVTAPPTSNVLSNGVAIKGISGAVASKQFWTLSVPAGASNLKFVTSGGSGDADLFVKFGSAPTTAAYDCKSGGSSNSETCSIATAQAGTYHILLNGYTAYSGLSLTGSYSLRVFSNGGLSTGASAKNGTAAPAGTTWSEAQNNAGNTAETNTTTGYSIKNASWRVADNFTVPSGKSWTLSSVDVYAYKTDAAATPSPFTAATLQVWRGRPGDAGSTLLCGDSSTNVLASSTDAKIYRIANSAYPAPGAATATTRKLWRNRLTVPASCAGSSFFIAGNYWLVWGSTDSGNGSHYAPPVTIVGARGPAGANARQYDVVAGAWKNLIDVGNPGTAADVAQEMPFDLNGSVQ